MHSPQSLQEVYNTPSDLFDYETPAEYQVVNYALSTATSMQCALQYDESTILAYLEELQDSVSNLRNILIELARELDAQPL